MSDTIRLFGRDVHKTTIIFVAQMVAFFLMVLGFLLFVWLWYVEHSGA